MQRASSSSGFHKLPSELQKSIFGALDKKSQAALASASKTLDATFGKRDAFRKTSFKKALVAQFFRFLRAVTEAMEPGDRLVLKTAEFKKEKGGGESASVKNGAQPPRRFQSFASALATLEQELASLTVMQTFAERAGYKGEIQLVLETKSRLVIIDRKSKTVDNFQERADVFAQHFQQRVIEPVLYLLKKVYKVKLRHKKAPNKRCTSHAIWTDPKAVSWSRVMLIAPNKFHAAEGDAWFEPDYKSAVVCSLFLDTDPPFTNMHKDILPCMRAPHPPERRKKQTS